MLSGPLVTALTLPLQLALRVKHNDSPARFGLAVVAVAERLGEYRVQGRVKGMVRDSPTRRLSSFSGAEPHWKAGRVWLPEDADWLPEFVREHTRFPRYRSDDHVDAASQAIAYLHIEGSSIGEYLVGVKTVARLSRSAR